MQSSTIQLKCWWFHWLVDVTPVDQLIWFLPPTRIKWNWTKIRPILPDFRSSISKSHLETSSNALKSYQLHSRNFPYLSNCWKLSKKLKLRTFHMPPDHHYSRKIPISSGSNVSLIGSFKSSGFSPHCICI